MIAPILQKALQGNGENKEFIAEAEKANWAGAGDSLGYESDGGGNLQVRPGPLSKAEDHSFKFRRRSTSTGC